MPRPLVPFLLACLLPLAALAAEPRELGPGLTLVRLHDLAEAVPTATGISILDLRYARDAAEADSAALRQHLRQAGPLRLVLYDVSPAPGLHAVLAERQANVVTLAPRGAEPAPDIAVAVEPAADRAGYDALEGGADLAVLADTNATKRRFDEAALVRARNRRNQPAAAPAGAPEAAAEGTPPPEAPVVDPLLQHAVRLARGLQALGSG